MFVPLYDKILVRRKDKEEVSDGGIVLPTDIMKELPCEGEVVAIGSGKVQKDGSSRSMSVKVGDRILFGKFGGTEHKEGNETLLIIKEDDVMGIYGEGLSESYISNEAGDKLNPIMDFIIFRFVMDITKSTFRPQTKSGIIISDVSDYDEHTTPKFAEILAYGPDVTDEIKNSKYVLLEAYGWTNKIRLNGPHGEHFWKTEEKFVLAMSDEEINPYN